MKPWKRWSLALAPLIPIFLLEASAANEYALIRTKYENSIVFVQSTKVRKDGKGVPEVSSGTGFVYSSHGHLLTASHVVLKEDDDHVVKTTGALRSRHEVAFPLEPVRRDEVADVMVLQFPDLNVKWRPVQFGNSKVVAKEAKLYTMGFPGTELASADGHLSSRHGPKGMWQTTLPINRGNSGGPVFDLKGRVVAVAIAGESTKQQITYAVPETHITGLVQIATQTRLEDGIYFANTPMTLAGQKVRQGFQFYESVEPNDKQVVKGESYCLPDGYRVTGIKTSGKTTAGSTTKLIELSPDPEKHNCVSMKALVASDKIGEGRPLGDFTRGWFGMNVLVEGAEAKKNKDR